MNTRNSRRFAPFFLALEGASRPSSKIIVNNVLFVYIVKQNKNNSRIFTKISWIFKILKNLMKIEFWLRQIFKISIIHKPSLGSLDVDKLIDIPIEEKVLYFLTIFTKSMGCSETLFKGTREANNDSYIS